MLRKILSNVNKGIFGLLCFIFIYKLLVMTNLKNEGSKVSRFRRWSHQSYSVFSSLNKEIAIGCLLVVYTMFWLPETANAQTDTIRVNVNQKLDEVVVNAQRTPVTYSQVARVVTVISRDEIKSAPVQSLQDLLEYALNVDVRQRGNHGVQADVSIRGGNFDQTMILLNGVNVSDPQTGHLSLNLPVSIESIERVEILKGPGARVFGPNAFSGAINFITGSKKNNNLQANVSGGENGFYSLGTNATILTGQLKSYLAISHKSSDGYIDNTDFKSSNVFYQGQLKTSEGLLDFQLGYTEKEFGANSFYTPKYPNQFESNKTTFASIGYQSKGKIKISPKLYWRRHQDRFELFRDNPASWYTNHNYHLTDVYGSSFNLSFSSLLGKTAAGVEFRSENIWSNVLGEDLDEPVKVPGEDAFFTKSHTRTNLSYFLEHNVYLDKFTFTAGVLANWNSDLGRDFKLYPGIDASYQLSSALKWYASLNKALRMPTFTDLYYSGPANIGNADLKPEEATTYESGIKFSTPVFRGHASVFRREGKNMIDWVKKTDEEKWQSQNITEVNTWGVEFSGNINFKTLVNEDFFVNKFSVNYTYLKMDKSANEFISQYVLDHLKHKLSFAIDHKIYRSLGVSWQASWQDREGSYSYFDPTTKDYTEERDYQPYWMMDAKLYWNKPKYTLYVEANNLFDYGYFDLGNVIQPGRWIRAGLKLNLDL